jgi:RTX calcium-binding nonapeptide repeat (4 copies)
VLGGDGFDTIQGGIGDDRLFGGAGPDDLSGSNGRDGLSGGGGWDFLSGGLASDILSGGSGRGNGSVERIDCGPGRRDVVRADANDTVSASCEVLYELKRTR